MWRCFHCNEVFWRRSSARIHFGEYEYSTPICRVDASYIRKMEENQRLFLEEDTILHRQLREIEVRMALACKNAEEIAYNSGLQDGLKLETRAELNKL